MKVHQKRLLDKGKIEKLVAALRLLRHTNPDVIAKLRTEAEYFEKNGDRMRYPSFEASTCLSAPGLSRQAAEPLSARD